MPVQNCSENGKPGYRWGSRGKCYVYVPGNEASRKKAKQKAYIQGAAIGEDEIFPIMIFKEEKIRDTWTTLGPTGLGTKVKASVYLNSQAREAGGVIFHNLSLKLKSLAAL